MRALVIEAPGRTRPGTVAAPAPAAGEVLVRVRTVGFCGSDLSTFRGANPLVTYPRVPGHEIAGVVEALGDDVPDTVRVGAAVTVVPYTACGACPACRRGRVNTCRDNRTLGVQRDGAMTELIAVPWKKLRAAPLSLEELALVEPLSVGFHAAARGRVTSSDTVLVFGCGMIGLGAIAAAGLNLGANVIAADIAPAKLALAQKAGARHVINSKDENLHERLAALTNGEGPNVVIEAVGAVETYQAAVTEVAFAGRVVYIGYGKAPVSYETKNFVLKELDILGSRNATDTDFDQVIALLRSGRYPTAETITRSVSWNDAAEALAAWAQNPAAVTKIQVQLS